MISREYLVQGVVQGVGFRPFVYRLAVQLQLSGWVQNCDGSVTIRIEGHSDKVNLFEERLITEAPSAAIPVIVQSHPLPCANLNTFAILDSKKRYDLQPLVASLPADLYCCPECQRELLDADNPRYHYAFINCTQCGPRYTIIKELPYDRESTSMRHFVMCAECRTEYATPNNRRFHAEPIACPNCGPQLSYFDMHHWHITDALTRCCKNLSRGKIIAVKGIGGFHLLCDATNKDAVSRLRILKPRPHKPFAVMVPPNQLSTFCETDIRHRQLLSSPARPVVLCEKIQNSPLADNIAPGLNELGVILPYSPLHLLLIEKLRKPLVVTSANISGEPVLTDAQSIQHRMSSIIDGILDHSRDILRPADDSVVHIAGGTAHTLRIGRGIAPLQLRLPEPLPPDVTLFACGGQTKATVALAFDDTLVISPHIADMHSLHSQMVFRQTYLDFTRLYRRDPTHLIHDAHPDYAASHWIREQPQPAMAIYHHHAHASSLFAQDGTHNLSSCQPIIAFTWDGVGLGEDNILQGGECFYGYPGHWKEHFHFRPIDLPGGDKAAREPWRIAESLRLHCNLPLTQQSHPLHEQWLKGINTPACRSVGRLLEGCAALLGLCDICSYEGQAAMLLEAAANQHTTDYYIELPVTDSEIDWYALIVWVDNNKERIAFVARVIHNSLARSLVQQAVTLSKTQNTAIVGISGGVFQNRLLVNLLSTMLPLFGLTLHNPEKIPVNDGGLCIGQAIEAAARIKRPSGNFVSDKTTSSRCHTNSRYQQPPRGGKKCLT